MSEHPVQVHVERTERPHRIHVVLRIVLLAAVGALGSSRLSWLIYLALPAFAALVILSRGSSRYLVEDAPRIVRVLHWLAGAYAYLWLLTDVLPTTQHTGPVELRVETTGTPTAASALMRLVTSIPALILVALLSIVGGLCWLAGAVCILVSERLPGFLADFLALLVRLQVRFLAYHLSLVDAYPSTASEPAVHAPT